MKVTSDRAFGKEQMQCGGQADYPTLSGYFVLYCNSKAGHKGKHRYHVKSNDLGIETTITWGNKRTRQT